MAVVTDNQQRSIRLLLHHLANIVVHSDIHIPNHILMFISPRVLRMIRIAVTPKIVLDTIRRREVREQHIHVLVLDCQSSQTDFLIDLSKEFISQRRKIFFGGEFTVCPQNIIPRIVDILLTLRIDANLTLIRARNHQAINIPAFFDIHGQNHSARKSLLIEHIPECSSLKCAVIKCKRLICILLCTNIDKVDNAVFRWVKTSINRRPRWSRVCRKYRTQMRFIILLHQVIQIRKLILIPDNHIPIHTVNAKDHQFSYHFKLLSNHS